MDLDFFNSPHAKRERVQSGVKKGLTRMERKEINELKKLIFVNHQIRFELIKIFIRWLIKR
jgi:hypothetical protein